MRNIPQVFYHQEIIDLINYFLNAGYESYRSLPEIDRQELTAACIHALGNDAYDSIIDHDDFDIVLHHFKQYLKTGKQEYALDLAETMAKNATEHFSQVLEDLFEEKFNHHEWQVNFESGLIPTKDQSTGELLWL